MIYLECDPDKALISTLGIPSKDIKHANSKGNVCNHLAKNKNVKGLVDEDPLSSQPNYLKRLKLHSFEHSIRVLYDEKASNHLIVLCPVLEEWILKAAKEAGVEVGDYGLPNETRQLHQMINTRIDSFKKLLKVMLGKSKMLTSLENIVKK